METRTHRGEGTRWPGQRRECYVHEQRDRTLELQMCGVGAFREELGEGDQGWGPIQNSILSLLPTPSFLLLSLLPFFSLPPTLLLFVFFFLIYAFCFFQIRSHIAKADLKFIF